MTTAVEEMKALIREGVQLMEARNGPIAQPTERGMAILYYETLLEGGKLSPSRRRLIEAELRNLKRPEK